MELDPSAYYAAYFAGSASLCASRKREALSYYQRAVELEPESAFAWLALGWTHVLLNQLVEGRYCLGRSVELESGGGKIPTAGAAGYLADCLRRSGALEEARARALEGLESAERSDHMYRDTFRALCLCVLGRATLAQGDEQASRAAFRQALSQLRGRPQALGGGQLAVQALAGLARAGEGSAPFEDALRLFERRHEFDFHYFYGCSDDLSLLELARAAQALGRPEEAQSLLARARAAGCLEPFVEVNAGGEANRRFETDPL
jgi:tetratricopeptide (TPR) repeat protein